MTISFNPIIVLVILLSFGCVWSIWKIKHGCIEADGGQTILAFFVIVSCVSIFIGMLIGHFLW